MKNPFKFLKPSGDKRKENRDAPIESTVNTASETDPAPEKKETEETTVPVADTQKNESADKKSSDDGFTEWCRTQVRGGIERRERNDIFEAYNVFGIDENRRLVCRCYHRYPEHERDFDLSYSRALNFDEFNKRLLGELDKGDMKLSDYNACIKKAEDLTESAKSDTDACGGFLEGEETLLKDFCEMLDNLTNKEYRQGEGIFRCSCESALGGESLNLWVRKPIRYDALDTDIAGVSKASIGGYDIEDMWIMGVYNRLRERCESCQVILLTSEWSLQKDSVYLFSARGFSGIDGTLLMAIGKSENFARFGFYSLDFSGK